MSFSRIPKTDGMRAGDNWLADLEPTKEEKRRKKLTEFLSRIEAALASDKSLLDMFKATLEMTHYTGRVDGLREGFNLYEYGLRIQNKKTAAFRAVMKYVVNNALKNPDMTTTKNICAHLDRELERIGAQKTSEAFIGPPEAWGYNRWADALKNKRNDVESLFSDARKEALGGRYCTLMAWATWGQKSGSGAKSQPKGS
jgi:hypothetical protein